MEIEPHSTLKNRALGLYYKICIQVTKKRHMLHYVDLFAGDGENICKKTDNTLRPAPFITQFLESAKKGEIEVACYLNDVDEENFEKLKQNVKPYAKFIKETANEDANEVYKKILNNVPRDEWSIFFLDPYNHTQLNFETIKEIAKHETFDKKNKCIRKPELIINLMTYTMQRNAKINKASVIKAIGGGDWVNKLDDGVSDEKTYEILHAAFIKNLQDLGYLTTSIEIRQTPPLNSVLYYLVFASSIPLAHDIQEKFKKDVLRYQKQWSTQNYRLRLISKVKAQGFKTLDEFS